MTSYNDKKACKCFSSQFKSYMHSLGLNTGISVDGEKEHLQKWGKLSRNIEPYSYRLFSRYCGNNPNIVPEEVGQRKIETVLNPLRFRAFYSDKNMYGLYLDKTCMPKTILRRIHGGPFLDADFTPFYSVDTIIQSDCGKLILKPAIGSASGRGVMLFIRKGDRYVSVKENIVLDKVFLSSYGDDFILQEAVEQHPYMAQFCLSSVNTLRLSVYRSIKDDDVHVIGSIMRIGKSGEFIDNAHSGGRFIGIDLATGKCGKYVCDQYGNMADNWNGINFKDANFVIPFWKEVIGFAKYVGKCNHHMRLLALDIALDKNGKPCLIEYNCEGFSYWLFMFTGKTPFGKYTDEIIDYCVKHPICKGALLI